jgi:agmatinase
MSNNIQKHVFGAIPEEFSLYEWAAIAVLPIPYDGTSTWMKGADLGPQAVLEASAHLELYDIETNSEVFKKGIVTLDPVSCPDDPVKMVTTVSDRATSVIKDGKFIVGIGGEHSVSVGLVDAMSKNYQNLSVLQFDAHSDTRDTYQGSPLNNACVMSRIGEMCPYAQVGIRSMDSSELERLKRSRTFFAHELLMEFSDYYKILDALTRDVYITIDLDVFDMSIMPSTGTPEPGGLDWYTVIDIIKLVAMEKNVVGIDITELLPNPLNKGPDFLAAKLIYRILSMVFAETQCNFNQ